MMRAWLSASPLFAANAPFVEALYLDYLADPASVEPSWRAYFAQLSKQAPTPVAQTLAVGESTTSAPEQQNLLALIDAYRFNAHRCAWLDPLKQPPPLLSDLTLAQYGFGEADLDRQFNTGSFGALGVRASLRSIVEALQQTYCASIGVEYMYMADATQKRWIQAHFEQPSHKPSAAQQRYFLQRLTAAETLERYLHRRYTGQKRFSLEGSESTILALDEIVRVGAEHGVDEVVIGMAHRGRLNVLANIFGKPLEMFFSEFEGAESDQLTSGDVKYHSGFISSLKTASGPVQMVLAFNPSHLEIVNPVIEGSVYARQRRRPPAETSKVLPLLIHGDAAVAGQGVNQEILNFSQTRGYGTEGTVHLIINNQIGFTTSDPRDYRSSTYCTDVFKMIDAPIFHVNGDDAEAVARVSALAIAYRQTFKRDVVIDLVCFRRQGHNEQDEPMVTQPMMYSRIAAHNSVRELYAQSLIEQGVCAVAEPQQFVDEYRDALDRGELIFNATQPSRENLPASYWLPFAGHPYTDECDTRLPVTTLQEYAVAITTVPAEYQLHPLAQKVIEDRREMGEGKQALNWGMAETLAYASLVVEGHGVRLAGQDSGRGTFFHRHAMLRDQTRERHDNGVYIPLQHVAPQQAPFVVIDSVLSEAAVLGFEYGYSRAAPDDLVIWEAQFGDFANNAQVVIDQFIASGELKWGRLSGLVLMLPHGYEGQGPEHSSARVERFMSLSAEQNWQVCMPTTPAQIYHLLRRQMHRNFRKPLVIFTPKSLLRHKDAVSTLEELAQGSFQTLIGEQDKLNPAEVKRVVLCTGKIYFELLAYRNAQNITDTALVRLEQLYPFPDVALRAELSRWPQAAEVVWCQEEPRNQGAWYWLASRQHLGKAVVQGQELHLVSRAAAAAPAVGYYSKHNAQQQAVIAAAFGPLESV